MSKNPLDRNTIEMITARLAIHDEPSEMKRQNALITHRIEEIDARIATQVRDTFLLFRSTTSQDSDFRQKLKEQKNIKKNELSRTSIGICYINTLIADSIISNYPPLLTLSSWFIIAEFINVIIPEHEATDAAIYDTLIRHFPDKTDALNKIKEIIEENYRTIYGLLAGTSSSTSRGTKIKTALRAQNSENKNTPPDRDVGLQAFLTLTESERHNLREALEQLQIAFQPNYSIPLIEICKNDEANEQIKSYGI